MPDKITIMVLKVDLQCSCCYKKVKKLLCKFPQIRDQVYDEKQNTVTITVLCCSPEKIRDKLCCKGGKVIESIEIKSPPKPKEPEKPKAPVEKPKEPVKPKEAEKPKEPEKPKPNVKPPQSTPAEKPTPKAPPMVPIPVPVAAPKPPQPVVPIPVPIVTGHGCPSIFPYEPCCGSCSQGRTDGPCYQGYRRPPCCGSCSQGRTDGPCYQGYGRPPNCYDNNYGYNNNNYNNGSYGGGYNDNNYGGGRPCCGSCSQGRTDGPCYQGYGRPPKPCDYYPIGDNTSSSACIIM